MTKSRPRADYFYLTETQRDECDTAFSADRTDPDSQEMPLEDMLEIDPNVPCPLRLRWIFAEAIKGAVTVEDYRRKGIPDPVIMCGSKHDRTFDYWGR
jgi:hypothetical protein